MVINADSMQLYRELEILSARPGAAALARAPHRLYGVLAASDACSAGRWQAMARRAIDEALAQGKLPIVTGGTGLYLKALSEGIAAVPEIDPALRARLRGELADAGPATLHARLARADPQGAATVRANDPQRILRALEVLEQTGRPLRAWHARRLGGDAPARRFARILAMPARASVYAACDARFDAMLAAGAQAEAGRMAALGLDPALPAMKAVGLAPLIALAEGRIGADEAVRRAKRDTRRYARRQMTWFRHQLVADRVIEEQFSESVLPKIFSFISTFWLTPFR